MNGDPRTNEDDPRTYQTRVRVSRPGGPPPASRALGRPEALLLLLGVVLLHAMGAFLTVDAAVWQQVAALRGEATRGDTPTVLAIDDAAVRRLGAPPYTSAQWRDILAALDRQQLGEIVLADPWPRILRPDVGTDAPAPGAATSVRVIVPSAVWDGRPLGPTPDRWPDAFRTTSASLVITPPLDGPLTSVQPGGDPGTVWWPCLHGAACPEGDLSPSFPLIQADVPVVSLALLLDAEPGFLTVGDAGVVMGVTAQAFAESIPLAGVRRVPWVVATAEAMGAARTSLAHQPLGLPEALAWLMGLYALASWVWQPSSWRIRLVVGPAFGLAAAYGLAAFTAWSPPVMATALVMVVPGAGHALAVARASVRVVRRLGLLVIRAASRAGTLRRRIGDVDGLVDVLADLTRSHGHDLPFALLLVPQRGRTLEVVGTYGLVASRFRDGALALAHPTWSTAAETTRGVQSAVLLKDGHPCLVVPLSQSGQLVGFWLLSASDGRSLPDGALLGPLAVWVGERLALPGHPGTFSADTALVPESVHDDALENLFLAADEERRRWLASVQALGVPVLVTDVAGVVSMINPAMEDALTAAGMPRVRSVRELLVLVDGEARIDRWVHRLYTQGRALALAWPTPDGHQVLAFRPVNVQRKDGATASLLCYMAWVEGGRIAAPPSFTLDVEGDDATELYLPRLEAP